MARVCTICEHPGLDDIDQALGAGDPAREVATRFGLSDSAMFRHRRAHLAELTSVHPARVRAVETKVRMLVSRLESYADSAHQSGKGQLFLSASRELRASVELLAGITGELESRPTTQINVFATVEGRTLLSRLRAFGESHPDIQEELASALSTSALGDGRS